MNREVIGAGRQGGTSLNICDFIPVFEAPKKSHLATLLFDFSRRKINIFYRCNFIFFLALARKFKYLTYISIMNKIYFIFGMKIQMRWFSTFLIII